MAKASAAQAAAGVAQTQPSSPTGLQLTDRQTAINVMSGMETLGVGRQAQLDALLAEGGQSILGVTPDQLTSRTVRSAIVGHSIGRAVGGGESGEAIFVTQAGRIELYDTHGVFRPTDRSRTLRVAADVAAYQSLLGGEDPSANAVPAPINVPGTPAPVATGKPSNTGESMVFTEAALSATLAVFLLVIGILTVRGSSWGVYLHWYYAPLKLAAVALLYVGWKRFESNYAGAWGISNPASTSSFGWEVETMTLLGAAYPLGLLIALMTKTVRTFYRNTA